MRKTVLFSLILALLFSLCACGASETEPASGVQESEDSVENGAYEENTSLEESENNPVEDSEDETVDSFFISEEVSELEDQYVGLTEDALSWTYDESTKTLTISGEGPMRDYLEEYPEWYSYCDVTERVVIGDGVSSVGAGAFWDFLSLNEVSLGSNIEFVGDYAFYYCWELRTVNFPTGLKYIGYGAFYNTLLHSDSGFILPEGLLYIGDNAFHSAFKESFVSLPASLIYIGAYALGNGMVEEFRVAADSTTFTAENGILYSKDMTTLINYPSAKQDAVYEIPETVTTILDEAIQVSNYLEKIVIPASVSLIDESAIFWNYALTSIEVDENNPYYQSVDGVLFTKDGKTLLSYPLAAPATEYSIPEGCERIGMAALSMANNLTVLSIPESLKEIGQWGLYGCSGISQLALPQGLTEIGTQAFDACNVLQEIHYAGSSADWDSIEISEENEPLFDGSITITVEKTDELPASDLAGYYNFMSDSAEWPQDITVVDDTHLRVTDAEDEEAFFVGSYDENTGVLTYSEEDEASGYYASVVITFTDIGSGIQADMTMSINDMQIYYSGMKE